MHLQLSCELLYFNNFSSFLPSLSIILDALFALLLMFAYVVFCESFLPTISFLNPLHLFLSEDVICCIQTSRDV